MEHLYGKVDEAGEFTSARLDFDSALADDSEISYKTYLCDHRHPFPQHPPTASKQDILAANRLAKVHSTALLLPLLSDERPIAIACVAVESSKRRSQKCV